MEGSERWERIPDFFAAAGDIQAKPTPVSGGFDLLVYYDLPKGTSLRQNASFEPSSVKIGAVV